MSSGGSDIDVVAAERPNRQLDGSDGRPADRRQRRGVGRGARHAACPMRT